MIETLAGLILQILTIFDGLSVAIIIGSVTILTILEITRKPHEDLDRGMKVARKVLGLGILTQAVYRGVDLVATLNLVTNGDIDIASISPIYLISLIMTLAAIAGFVLNKMHKLQNTLFVFLQASLWYTMFVLSQFAARVDGVADIGRAVITLLSLIIVILLILLCDSAKRYYHKPKKAKK